MGSDLSNLFKSKQITKNHGPEKGLIPHFRGHFPGLKPEKRLPYRTTFFFPQRSFIVRTLSVEKMRAAITTMTPKKAAM